MARETNLTCRGPSLFELGKIVVSHVLTDSSGCGTGDTYCVLGERGWILVNSHGQARVTSLGDPREFLIGALTAMKVRVFKAKVRVLRFSPILFARCF